MRFFFANLKKLTKLLKRITRTLIKEFEEEIDKLSASIWGLNEEELKEIKILFVGGSMRQDIMERLKAISKRLKKEYNAQRVILFGSYAKGEATEDSDIDLLVIAPTQERFYHRMATALALVRDLYHGLPISPIVLRPEEVEERRRRGDQFVERIVREGLEI